MRIRFAIHTSTAYEVFDVYLGEVTRGIDFRHGAHVVYEPTLAWTYVDRVAREYLLAATGRCNRGWHGGKVEMT